MWVIKVGGSLQDSAYLQPWLGAILMHGAGRLVAVPGGGRFADAVRESQRRFGFDDAEAHRRAVRAMEAYAAGLRDAAPGLVPVDSGGTMRTVLENGGVPLWLPSAMVAGAPELPESWSVTSDSLALWLAQQLSAEGLALVKSVDVDALRPLDELAGEGVIDAYFPELFQRGPVNLAWFEARDHGRLQELLDYGVPRVVTAETPRPS